MGGNRPYVFCHMCTSLDGKIMGPHMGTSEGRAAAAVFYDIAFGDDPFYKHQGWLSGRVTTDDNFTHYEEPALDPGAAGVPEGDYVAPRRHELAYISIDASGRLGWKEGELHYRDTTADIIEVLSGRVSNEYKAFLRGLGISYITAGDGSLDFQLVLEKLHDLFGMRTVMLGGGGILNWSLIEAGLCDELSLVVAATADGALDTPALFSSSEGLVGSEPVGFRLIAAEAKENGCVWLRYAVNNAKER